MFFVSQNDLSDSLVKLLGIQYKIYRLHTDDITRHIDELFFIPQEFRQHIWANVSAGKLSDKASGNAYKTFQAGYDYAWAYDGLRWFVGGLADYTYGNLTADLYAGKVHSVGLGAYFQGNYYYQKNFGLSIDAYAKYAFNHYNTDGRADLDYNTFTNNYHLMFFNLRAGFKAPISYDNSWFLEPGMRVSWAYINRADYVYKTTAPQLNPDTGDIRFRDIDIHLQQEAGKIFGNQFFLNVGKIYQNDSIYFDVRTGLSFAYDSSTGGDMQFVQDGYEDHPIKATTPRDYRLGVAFASNLAIKENLKFYLDFKRTFFSHVDTSYLVTFGFRLEIGRLFKRPAPPLMPAPIKRQKRPLNRYNVGDGVVKNDWVRVRSRSVAPKEVENQNFRPKMRTKP
ncbi:autotransporter outer membrane beta-barrel domain-containing protein [Helicobacter sp. 11S02596-1]|uniref:autotransporter outer membrane beta-barrel domain-containing protein n=1 Tax=Helicobacter sp. 11S02596-1 TaxID=1476194 RepID=UPI000BDADE76|nr:autotransporter outer membrane beta-barrel domain-containing protein [Helicobacter sp. 11S02596-1]PAF41282.1 hypothetical protein BJI48_08835 [Helicobacter sp. 11S02596-1]